MTSHLPSVPTLDELASAAMTVRYGEIFNAPALTNFLGAAQVDTDLLALANLNFPPFFGANHPTGRLYVDGEYLVGTGAPITFTWFPDRVVREVEYDGLRLTSTTALAVGRMGVVVSLEVENLGAARELALAVQVSSYICKHVVAVRTAVPPADYTDRHVLADRGAVGFTGVTTDAALVQGCSPLPTEIDDHELRFRTALDAGATYKLSFVIAVAESLDDATALYDELIVDVDAELAATRASWEAELRAVVTPGNDRYGGHMPELHTSSPELRKLYWMGILGMVWFKRDTPYSVVGRTYDTLTPAFWPTITFLWDYSLSGTIHALLDPTSMKAQLEQWMKTDIHTCMATSWLTGEGVGVWYAVNDYAMTRLMRDYLRWHGDEAWLDAEIETHEGETRRPVDELVKYARNWRRFETKHGLADYGGIGNLLECVSTYVHEVASLNSANVYNLRTAADVLERRGDAGEAASLRAEATELVARVQELYLDGQGFWGARFPDGSLVPVRHVYDLLTVLYTIADDLSETQKQEMVTFWETELRTDLWLRALSNRDGNATFSVRADHQWNGAYVAWPSELALGLYRIGRADEASTWLKTLASSANQGPYGQAHFAENVIDPIEGGARKVPLEMPFINDWACSGGGSWANLVIEGVFGIDAGLGSVSATPALDGFDSSAKLTGLTIAGTTYEVDAAGLREVSE
ncbi:MAG: hypothetical protein ACI867_000012 [Glaciecola sp.]|jgi:hypothetical protein